MKAFVHRYAALLLGVWSFDVAADSAVLTKVTIDDKGAIHAPAFVVPLSHYLGPASQKAVLNGFANAAPRPTAPWAELSVPGPAIDNWRQAIDAYMQVQVQHLRSLYAVEIESKKIAGVPTDVVTPRDGVSPRNRDRVLINLHGGGYLIGARFGGQGESIPIAALGRIKVIAVNYRQAPEFRFPAASIDVAVVFRELLTKYRPENIGIYGCSAGGRLTAQAVAWLQKEKLPLPGAIGIFCGSAGAGVDGDSNYIAPLLNGMMPPPPGVSVLPKLSYLEGADPNDALVSPDRSPALLAHFPPTLLISGTRDMEMSAALHTHNALVKVGVDAQLHIWDGLGHGFFNVYPDIEESRDALNVIVRFFDKHLGVRK